LGRLNSFEEIEVWKKSMVLCSKVYLFINEWLFSKDFMHREQIRKSSVSIPSNIAQGFDREVNHSFIYFLVITKGSAREIRTQLTIAKNLNYINEEVFKNIHNYCLEFNKQLSGFISYLRQIRAVKQFSKFFEPS
jgi:four helix bundle protein